MGLWRRHLLAMDTRGLRLDLRLLARSKRGAGGDPSQTLFPIIRARPPRREAKPGNCGGLCISWSEAIGVVYQAQARHAFQFDRRTLPTMI